MTARPPACFRPCASALRGSRAPLLPEHGSPGAAASARGGQLRGSVRRHLCLSHLWASRETRLGSGVVTKDTKGFRLPFYVCSHGELMDVPPAELPEKVEKKTNKCK